MKLLVVEDDNVFAKSLDSVLSLENEVQLASTLSNAKSIIDRNKFDCLITDIKLSDGSGCDLIDYTIEKGYDLPIVVMTGFTELADNVKRIDCIKVLNKPFTIPDLLDTISNAVKSFDYCHISKCSMCDLHKSIKSATLKINNLVKDIEDGRFFIK